MQTKIEAFESRRAFFYGAGLLHHAEILDELPVISEDMGEEWDKGDDTNPLIDRPAQPAGVQARWPEQLALTLPSTLGHERCVQVEVTHLGQMELKLRQGQANDTLHQIRIAVGQKSFLFRENVRKAKSQQTKTRAWAQVTTVDNNLRQYARIYVQARKAMVSLGAAPELLARFQELRHADLKVSTAISEPNARGQSKEKMAWFFTMDQRKDIAGSKWMEECKSNIVRVYHKIETRLTLLVISLPDQLV